MTKQYFKKLTNAGSASCVFAVLAFVFALCGAVLEPVSTAIHNAVFEHDIDNMFLYTHDDTVMTIYHFFDIYGSGIFMAVLSFVAMIILFKNKRTKGLTAASASLIIFAALAAIPLSVFGMITEIQEDILKLTSDDTDQTVFVSVCRLLVFCLPLIAGFFLLLSGLFLALRLSGESFTVEVERAEKAAAQMFDGFPADNQYAAGAFMPEQNSVQPQAVSEAPVEAVVPEPTAAPEVSEEPAAPATCPHCGAVLKTGAKFCSACGQKV